MKYLVNWDKLVEKVSPTEQTFTMYHGTSIEGEELLLERGWEPYKASSGSQQGNPAYLYVCDTPEGAEWYAADKGNDSSVLEIRNIPKSCLGIDPEDCMSTNLDKELAINTQFTIRKPLSAVHFSKFTGVFSLVRGNDFDDYD